QDVVTHDSLTPARVTHRTDASQIKFADKLGTEGNTARRVEAIQDVEMFLHQLRSRESAEIENLIIYRVDAVCADGDNNVTITRETFSNVVVSLKTRNRLA